MAKKIPEPDYNKIDLRDYHYDLPEQQIAKFPLEKRDQSKLLVYQKGSIVHRDFQSITDLITPEATLFFNDTKVIPARLHFEKDTGAQIEIFLLKPSIPLEISQAMKAIGHCQWLAMVGNLKRWTPGTVLNKSLNISGETLELKAELIDREERVVHFSWTGTQTFSELLEAAGKVPLPPYLKREVEPEDKPRYQTVYSANDGAVAAPTAGLHFTNDIIHGIKAMGVHCEYLTLHVSAGTFQPIKEHRVEQHPMHSEQIVVTRDNVINLMEANKVIAVGTTSMRTLESLYWYGVKLSQDPKAGFQVEKLLPYQFDDMELPSLKDSCSLILEYMNVNNLNTLHGSTEIFIIPGYRFRVCQGLVTNFHLPGSTLILLVAAFIGTDWRSVYQQALKHNYRFLSYGDSSLLLL